MGEDFMTFAPLSVTEQGWISNFFGLGGNLFYYQNHVMAGGITDTISDGDFITFDLLVDTINWSDTYVFCDSLNKKAFVNTPVEFTFTKVGYTSNEPAAGLSVTVDGVKKGTTDENGKIMLTFDKIGTYEVSSENTIGATSVFMPYCLVNVTNCLFDYIEKQELAAAQYVAQESYSYTDSYHFVRLMRSGCDVSEYADAYASSVKKALDENGGKLINPDTGKEDLGLYGSVIIALRGLGYNTTDFYGYDIEKAFNDADVEEARTANPYYYAYAIEAADTEKAKAIINDYIANYYTLGSGMNYWGYSCDNTSMFLVSITPYAEDYAEYVTDAKTLIKTYITDKGAFGDNMYMTAPNTDSTALALAAFASVGDTEEAYRCYGLLVDNFESEVTGRFIADYDPVYATKDALFALYYFKNDALKNIEFNKEKHVSWIEKIVKASPTKDGKITRKCSVCGKEEIVATIPKADSYNLSAKSYKYNGKARKPTVTVARKGEKIDKSQYKVTYKNNVDAGTAKATVTFTGKYYTGSKALTFKINKAANTVKVKGRTAKLKYSKLSGATQTISRKKAISVSKSKGKVTYKKLKGKQKITISKSGKITVKKGLKKGTYKLKVKVTAAGNKNYKKKSKTVTVTIKVE